MIIQYEKELEKTVKKVIELRRYFHQYPEIGLEEFNTSKKIQQILEEIGISYQIKGKTGVVGFINRKSRITIGIRADMDALPIKEETKLPFASKNLGIMHACGHDAHMAILLGVSELIFKFKENLKLNVKLIFQPCEEKPPGGANLLIKENVLENVDYLIGFHLNSDLPLNKVYIKKGVLMANTDRFRIIIIGKGGHGSTPDLVRDPIVCASYLITNLQTILSRKISPFDPCVLSVCKIKGGETFNVIPNEVEIEGTVRTLSEKIRKKIKNEMERIIRDICHSFGCKFNFTYDFYCPSLKNDGKLATKIINITKKILPKNSLYTYHPSMGGEDFAFYTEIVPSVYIFIGCGKKSGIHHSSHFNLDERCLPFTVNYLTKLVLNFS